MSDMLHSSAREECSGNGKWLMGGLGWWFVEPQAKIADQVPSRTHGR